MPSKSVSAKPFTILGIETSCDETAAAVVRGCAPGPGQILSNIVFSQTEAHAPYGGVVPEIASRAHLEILDGVIEQALAEADVTLADLDGIAATAGPGLVGGVMVGLTTAKALALASGKPLIAVNHLMGHALTARLTHGVVYPFLLLLVSGGHCQLLGVGGTDDFRLYGGTIDDAVGEAFDKTAKILGLPYPGGPPIDREARAGAPDAIAFPRGLTAPKDLAAHRFDFSFSGLKTAVARWVEARQRSGEPVPVADVAASFQEAVADVLTMKAVRAATDLPCTVGFGIRTPDQAGAIAKIADGVVVGSAIVGKVEGNLGAGKDKIVAEVLELARSLAGSTHAARHDKVDA